MRGQQARGGGDGRETDARRWRSSRDRSARGRRAATARGSPRRSRGRCRSRARRRAACPASRRTSDEDVLPRRAQGHAHADLVAAADDHEGDDAVEADHGEERGEEAEEGREARHQALTQEAVAQNVAERPEGHADVGADGAVIAEVSDGRSVASGRSERTTNAIPVARLRRPGPWGGRRSARSPRGARRTWCRGRGRRSGSAADRVASLIVDLDDTADRALCPGGTCGRTSR